MSIASYTKQQIDTAPVDAGYRLSDMDESSNYMQNLAAEKAAAVERKRSSLKPYSDLDKDSYTMMPDGMIEDNKNKVFNNYSDDDYASMFSYAVGKYGLQPTQDGNWVDPQGKVYKSSETRSLYGYGTKESDDAFKMGIAANLGDGNSDYRYLEGRAKELGLSDTYKGWGSGVLGVDTSKKQFDIVLPHDVATMLEGLQHGRAGAMEDRLVRDVNSPMAESLYGSGKSEYYTDMQSVLPTKGKTAGMSLEDAAAAFEGKRSELADKGLIRGSAGQSTFDPVAYNEQVQKAKYDRMDFMDKVGQTVSSIPAGIVKGATDLLDAGLELSTYPLQEVVRQVTGDKKYDIDLISDEGKQNFQKSVDKAFGYDRSMDERSISNIMKELEATGTDITSVDSWVDLVTNGDKLSRLGNAAKIALYNPSIIAGQLSEIFGAGGALKAAGTIGGKVVAKVAPQLGQSLDNFARSNRAVVAAEMQAVKNSGLSSAEKLAKLHELEKSYTLAKAMPDIVKGTAFTNADLMVRMNNDITAFKESNGGEDPSAEKMLSMLVLNKVAAELNMAVDKKVLGIRDLPTAEVKGLVTNAVKAVGGAISKLTTGSVTEGVQETIDGAVEQINQKFGSLDYAGKSVEDVLRESSAEILAGTVIGTVGGAQMASVSGAIGGVSDLVGNAKMPTFGNSNRGAADTEEVERDVVPTEQLQVDKDKYNDILTSSYEAYTNNVINENNVADYLDQLEELQELRYSLKNSSADAIENADAAYGEIVGHINKLITNNPTLKLNRALVTKLADPTTLGSQSGDVEVVDTTGSEYTDADRAVDAERLLHFVLSEGTEVTPELSSKYGTFAKTNGIEEARFQEIIKSYESVEDEATIGMAGYKSYGAKLDALLRSGKPDTAKLSKYYGKVSNWYATTVNSINQLEEGIRTAENLAKKLNTQEQHVSTNKSTKSVATEYVKLGGKKAYDINVYFDTTSGKWYADTADAKKRIEAKQRTATALDGLIDKYNTKAFEYLPEAVNVGKLMLPSGSASSDPKIVKARKADSSYVANKMSLLSKVAGTSKAVNRVVLDTESKLHNGKKIVGVSAKWKSNSDYARVNSVITNVGTKGKKYSADDVVLLHAIKEAKLKSGLTSTNLYHKDSAVHKEMMQVVDAGSTVVLDRDYIANKTKYVTRDGKSSLVQRAGELTPLGKSVAQFLRTNGYVELGNSKVFVKAGIDQAKVKAYNEKLEADKQNKAARTRALNSLVGMTALLNSGEVLTEQETELLNSKIAESKELAIHNFTKDNLATVSTDEGGEVEVGDTETTLDDEQELDVGDRFEPQIEEEVEVDLRAEALDQTNDPEAKLGRYLVRRQKELVAEVRGLKTSEELSKEIEDLETEIADQLVDHPGKPLIKLKTELAILKAARDVETAVEDADAGVAELLAVWKELVDSGLTGRELESQIEQLLQNSGELGSLLNADGRSLRLAQDVLDAGVGKGKQPVWEKIVATYDSNGKVVDVTTQAVFSQPTPEDVAKWEAGYVRDGKKQSVIAVRKVEIDPSTYVEAGNKSTVLSKLPASVMPTEVRNRVAKFTAAFNQVVKPLSEVEKGDASGLRREVGTDKFNLHNSPARALVFSTTGAVSPQVMTAMHFALMDVLTTDLNKLSLGYKSDADIGKMFGVDASAVTKDMRLFALENGMLQKTLASSLGKAVLKQLGYKNSHSDAVGKGHYEALVADIGNMTLLVGQQQKLLEVKDVPSNTLKEFYKDGDEGNPDVTTKFVNVVGSKVGNKYVPSIAVTNSKEYFEQVSEIIPGIKTREVWPSSVPLTDEAIAERLSSVRNDVTGVHSIPETAKEVLEVMMKTPYEVDTEVVNSFLKEYDADPENIKEILGYIPLDETNEKYNKLTYENKAIQEAINRDVERSIEVLRKLVEGKEGKFDVYFEHYYTGNGRYMLDSNTINPQTDKLHRFLIQPKSHNVTHKVTTGSNGAKLFSVQGKDGEVVDTSYYVRIALAQAFGKGVDKTTTEDLIKMGNALVSLNKDQLAQVKKDIIQGRLVDGELKHVAVIQDGDSRDARDSWELEPEHLSHTLQAIRFLENALSGEVTSSLTAESDSLTSGFFNKMQQYPMLENRDEHLARVGILLDDYLKNKGLDEVVDLGKHEGMNALLSKKGGKLGFYDSYKNLARATLGNLPIKLAKLSEGSGVASTYYKLYTAFQDYFPGAGLNAQSEIDSALRSLFKNPFMIFNYSAAISTITKNLSRDIADKLIEEVASGSDKGLEIAGKMVKQGVTVDSKAVTVEQIVEVARTRPSSVFRVGKFGFVNTMTDSVQKVYGEAVKDTFETEFKQFIDIQNLTNDAFKVTFRMFEKKLKDKYGEVQKRVGFVSDEEMNKIVKELWNDFPFIVGPLTVADGNTDVIPVVGVSTKTELERQGRKSPQTQTLSKQDTVNPIIKLMVEPRSAGSVLPFHFIDGAELGTMLLEFNKYLGNPEVAGMLPVHDAVTAPIHEMDMAGWLYNKAAYEVNKGYSLMDALKGMVDKWPTTLSDKETREFGKLSGKGLKEGGDVDLPFVQAMQQIKGKIAAKAEEVAKARELLHKDLENATINNMIATVGMAYRVGSTEPDTDYVKDLVSKYVTVDVHVEGQQHSTKVKSKTVGVVAKNELQKAYEGLSGSVKGYLTKNGFSMVSIDEFIKGCN